MTKQDIIERAKHVSFSSNPKDYIEFVGELAKENDSVPADTQDAAKAYADKRLSENNRGLAESGHTRHFKMGYVCFAGYEIEEAFMDGMLAERERMMKEAVDGEVVSDLKNVNYVRTMSKIPDTLYFGEKVDVIIIKKEK